MIEELFVESKVTVYIFLFFFFLSTITNFFEEWIGLECFLFELKSN